MAVQRSVCRNARWDHRAHSVVSGIARRHIEPHPLVLLIQKKKASMCYHLRWAIVIAESLARVKVAIRIASVRWRSYLPRKHRHSSQTLRSLCRDLNRAIGVHSYNIRSTWIRRGKSTRKNPPKIKKFIWTCFSEQLPLGSWLVSQEERQKLARTFENVHVNVVYFWYFGIWGGLSDL